MASLSLLFFDGGATVAAGASAVAGWIGLKQRQEDAEELVFDVAELEKLLEELQTAHAVVHKGHRALSEAWRSPLSLFEQRDELAAIARGVEPWVVNCAHKARRLADEASMLCNRADEYETQLSIAMEPGGRGLQRSPVQYLIQHLRDLTPNIGKHVRFLKAARAAFDSADGTVVEGMSASEYLTAEEQATLNRSVSSHLPEHVLRNKGQLGELINRSGIALQTFARGVVRRPRDDGSVDKEPKRDAEPLTVISAAASDPEFQRMQKEKYVKQLQSDNWFARREAAQELGRIRDAAAVKDLCAALRGDSSDSVREWAAIALGQIGDTAAVPDLCEMLRDPFCRHAAAESLQLIGEPNCAPLIFAAQQNDELSLDRLLNGRHIEPPAPFLLSGVEQSSV